MSRDIILYGTLGSAAAIGGATGVLYWWLTRPRQGPAPPVNLCELSKSAWQGAGRSSRYEPTDPEKSAHLERVAQLQQVYGCVFNLKPLEFTIRAPGRGEDKAKLNLVPFTFDFPAGSNRMPLVGYLCLVNAVWDREVVNCLGGWTWSTVGWEGGRVVSVPDLFDVASGGSMVPGSMQVIAVAGGHTNNARTINPYIGNPAFGIKPFKVVDNYYWQYNSGAWPAPRFVDAYGRSETDLKADIEQEKGQTGQTPYQVLNPVLYSGWRGVGVYGPAGLVQSYAVLNPVISRPDWISAVPDNYAAEFQKAYGRLPQSVESGAHMAAPGVRDWEELL